MTNIMEMVTSFHKQLGGLAENIKSQINIDRKLRMTALGILENMIAKTLNMQEYLQELDVGLNELLVNRLSPFLIKPAQIRTVIK